MEKILYHSIMYSILVKHKIWSFLWKSGVQKTIPYCSLPDSLSHGQEKSYKNLFLWKVMEKVSKVRNFKIWLILVNQRI